MFKMRSRDNDPSSNLDKMEELLVELEMRSKNEFYQEREI